MSSKQLPLWDANKECLIESNDYTVNLMLTPIIIPVEGKALYALHAYKTLLAKLQEAKHQNIQNMQAYRNKFTYDLQTAIEVERSSIIEGMREVQKICHETLVNLNTQKCPAIKDNIETTNEQHISKLVSQKHKVEADIVLLENAMREKIYKPVEYLLKDADATLYQPMCHLIGPKGNEFKYSWNGEICTSLNIMAKTEKKLKNAFYSPFLKMLGKRTSRSAYSSPKNSVITDEREIKKIEREITKSGKKMEDTNATFTLKAKDSLKSEIESKNNRARSPRQKDIIVPQQQKSEVLLINPELIASNTEIPAVMTDSFAVEILMKESDCYAIKPTNAELCIIDSNLLTSKKYMLKPNSPIMPLNFATCIHLQKLHISGGDKENGFIHANNLYNITITPSYFMLNEMKGMLYPKRQHTMVSVENRFIFSIGGYDALNKEHIKICERYDETLKWVRMPDLSKERRGITGVYLSNHLYAFAGNCESTVNVFERMNISSCCSWELLKVNLGSFGQRFLAAGVAISNTEMLLFGGYDKDARNDVCILNVENKSVKKAADMMRGDFFYQRVCTKFSNYVVIAGQDKPIHVHRYCINSGEWTMHKLE